MKTLCELHHCANYRPKERPIAAVYETRANFESHSSHTHILHILQGSVSISYGMIKNYTLTEGNFMLFPPGIPISGHSSEKTKTLVIKLVDDPIACDKFSLELLYRGRDTTRLQHTHLESNEVMKVYMEQLAKNIENGLQCFHFMALKLQEFFFYLRAYYSDEELVRFNLPLLSADARFMAFIWQNYRQVHNVEQFAEKAHSSLAAFKVKFKKVTGVSPSQWLMEQKARNVYHEICCGQKSLKEISREYHFSSVSHLGTFCQKNFGKPPGSLKPGKDPEQK